MKLLVDIRKKLESFKLDVNFEVNDEVIGLLGPSGSGKSMTLRCIAGVEKPDEGQIVLNGRVLYDSEKGINLKSRKRKTGFLFQNYALFPNMTVAQNIAFGIGKISSTECAEKIDKLMNLMYLKGFKDRYPFMLSGGQQQRVALARALAAEPEVLLLDEPFSALDSFLRTQMVEQLSDLLTSYKGTALFVTHNMEEAYRMCKNLAVLVNGKIEAFGSIDEIFENPPTLNVARLTGYKNIFEVAVFTEGKVKIAGSGLVLNVKKYTKNTRYIAIRSQYISIADNCSYENNLDCWPVCVNETPLKKIVNLSIGKPETGKGGLRLEWEIDREIWRNLQKMSLPWRIYIDPEKIVTFSR